MLPAIKSYDVRKNLPAIVELFNNFFLHLSCTACIAIQGQAFHWNKHAIHLCDKYVFRKLVWESLYGSDPHHKLLLAVYVQDSLYFSGLELGKKSCDNPCDITNLVIEFYD